MTFEDDTFFDDESYEPYLRIMKKVIVPEWNIMNPMLEAHEIKDYIVNHGLLHTVEYVTEYSEDMVYEFYANMKPSFRTYHKVRVRGHTFSFGLDDIKEYLGLDGVSDEVVYDRDTLAFELSHSQAPLSREFTALLVINKCNWLPTKNGGGVTEHVAQLLLKIAAYDLVDLGTIIFNEIWGS